MPNIVKQWFSRHKLLSAVLVLIIYITSASVWVNRAAFLGNDETFYYGAPSEVFERPPACGFSSPVVAGVHTLVHCSLTLTKRGIEIASQFPNSLRVELSSSDQSAKVQPLRTHPLDATGNASWDFDFVPHRSGSQQLDLGLYYGQIRENGRFTLDVGGGWSDILLQTAIILFSSIFVYVGFTRIALVARAKRQKVALAEQKIAEAENKAEEAPERAKFAWDLARVKLEAYFDRNLAQVNQVFWLAVAVMSVGFSFVLWAALMSLNQPRVTPTSLVAAVSGIITQFIGATFLVIYRSTMTQANEFMAILERINVVGMAIQVLDSIPEDQPTLKNSTRADIVKLLLATKNPTKGQARPLKQRNSERE